MMKTELKAAIYLAIVFEVEYKVLENSIMVHPNGVLVEPGYIGKMSHNIMMLLETGKLEIQLLLKDPRKMVDDDMRKVWLDTEAWCGAYDDWYESFEENYVNDRMKQMPVEIQHAMLKNGWNPFPKIEGLTIIPS